jgi:hypothetical protein
LLNPHHDIQNGLIVTARHLKGFKMAITILLAPD